MATITLPVTITNGTANDATEVMQDLNAIVNEYNSTVGGLTGDLLTTSNTKTATNKTFTSPVINTSVSGTAILDEDNMASNSDTKIPTQQSVKAYTDTKFASVTVPVKATGAEVTTGTDDAKFATPKALADAGVNTRLLSKVIVATRDHATATGDVAYTGVGFKPTSIIAIANTAGTEYASWGAADSAKTGYSIDSHGSNAFYQETNFIYVNTSVGGAYTIASVSSYDNDGFTLTWTKNGSPTGTISLIFLCFR